MGLRRARNAIDDEGVLDDVRKIDRRVDAQRLVRRRDGHGRVMKAYRHAIDGGYRFYSYGDATLFV